MFTSASPLNSSIIVPLLSNSCFLFFVVNNSILCCPYNSGSEAIHWIVTDLPWATSLKKMDCPFSRNHQSSVVPQLRVGLPKSFPLH